MMFRKLKEVFYVTPTLCMWENDREELYGITVCLAWLNWAFEFTIGAHRG